MENLSGIILTKNNQRTIASCLNSITSLIKELIIIDDFSTDSTLEIIKQIYPEVIIKQKKLERFDEQRNYGISLANNNWILMIDSDEVITPELANSIKDIKEEKNIVAYWVVRMNQLFDKYISEKHIHRPILFKKELRFSCPVHEIIKIDKNKKKKLAGTLKHENWVSISENMKKMNDYSSLIAQKWIDQNRNYSNVTLFLFAIALPIRYFFICLFKKKFYKAGLFNGIFYSFFESYWWLAVIFKYKEKQKK
ncbi:MAG: glycosyltransferase family 2 protein [Patescibacteria group bacterium]|jgi:glycosyltransferase involved in cell wall biosynthesis|nr:glycosyltransferase family 2 protein [bacterium]HQC49753.1 glycosyltransferase family 2 protein [bacterium]